MKLIDILVEELPKRGGWPDGVRYITQDNGYDTYKGTICGYDSLPEFNRKIWLSNKPDRHANVVIMRINNISSDYTTAIITREQYESALAAKNEGWIEWGGGECPVPRGTLVDVKYLCGDVNRHIKAGELDSSGSIDTAFAVRWSKLGAEYDIIAYRLHQPEEAAQSKAGDEADMNECIVQDIAPVWNGDGLPPVGCFCEITDPNGMLVYGQGESGEVIAHVENTAVIRMSYGLGCFEAGFLRPLRTEAERKREDVRKAIYAAMNIIDGDIADAIYDAIAAGKIPGVKLDGL